MSDTLRITCPCGYENWVPAEKRGQVVPCFICGEDLLIEEPAADQNSSTAPSAQSTESTLSTPSINKPRSPFEADDVETAVRPKFQHAPPTPAPAKPTASRPRSPFEPDAPPEGEGLRRSEEKFVADPFTRELMPAPKPTPSMIDEMEKHRPTERRSRHVFIDSISPHDAPTGETCAQCGRALRGSWDRHETPAGVLCYICTNQATHDVPERVKAGSGHRTELRETELLVDPVHIRNAAPVEPDYGVTQTPGFKKFILWMAFGLLGITFFVWLTGWGGSSTPPVTYSAADEVPVPVPDFIRYIVWAVRTFGAFLGAVLAIYLTLDRDNRLPHERLLLNVINIGAFAVLIGVLGFIVKLIGEFYIDSAGVGFFWYFVTGVLILCISIYLLLEWFDFQFFDFLWLYFFYMPMVQIVIGGIGYFLQWGLYEWVV